MRKGVWAHSGGVAAALALDSKAFYQEEDGDSYSFEPEKPAESQREMCILYWDQYHYDLLVPKVGQQAASAVVSAYVASCIHTQHHALHSPAAAAAAVAMDCIIISMICTTW